MTGKLPSLTSLPYGVRQIFSPTTGRKIRNIKELVDGKGYVCAGFEQFRPMNYDVSLNEPSVAQRVQKPPQAFPRPSAHRPRVHQKASHDETNSKASNAVTHSRDIKSPRDNKSKVLSILSFILFN